MDVECRLEEPPICILFQVRTRDTQELYLDFFTLAHYVFIGKIPVAGRAGGMFDFYLVHRPELRMLTLVQLVRIPVIQMDGS